MGRRLPDGTIAFVGRKDSQVKVRGFRIELGEVESVLGGHPEVDECAVLARADAAGSTRLIAYVRPSSPRDGNWGPSLGRSCSRSCLEYMIPSAFVVQPWLPLTANGKLDRKCAARRGGAIRGERGVHRATDIGRTRRSPGSGWKSWA